MGGVLSITLADVRSFLDSSSEAGMTTIPAAFQFFRHRGGRRNPWHSNRLDPGSEAGMMNGKHLSQGLAAG